MNEQTQEATPPEILPPATRPATASLKEMRTEGFLLRPTTFEEQWRVAQLVAASQFVPAQFRGKPADCLIAMTYGAEIGLSPIQSLQNIAVINGRPSVWGDAALGIVRASPSILSINEKIEGSGEAMIATCTVRRTRGKEVEETVRTFDVADAKAAKLWQRKGQNGADTPWVTYPKRMLQMRARGFALRDSCADILKGLILAEEAIDIEPMRNVTPATVAFQIPEGTTGDLLRSLASELHWTDQRLQTEYAAAGSFEALADRMQRDLALRQTGPRAKRQNGAPKPVESPVSSPVASVSQEPSDAQAEQPEAQAQGQPEVPQGAPTPADLLMTEKQKAMLFALLGQLEIKGRPERLAFAAEHGIEIDSYAAKRDPKKPELRLLSQEQAGRLIDAAQARVAEVSPEELPL